MRHDNRTVDHIHLVGHSGCTLEVIKSGEGMFVRKTSRSADYNRRLEHQCRKQRESVFARFGVPRVYREGHLNGRYYFDMEYVSGVTLAEHLKDAFNDDVKRLAALFAAELLNRAPEGKTAARDACAEKIRAVERSIARHAFTAAHGRLVRESLSMLRNYGWETGGPSPCHGDLTFENVIVGREGLFLVDFLDSFYNSWLVDLSKILQDLEVYWSFRHNGIDQNTRIRCALMKEIILGEVAAARGKDAVAFAYHALVLNLLRIVPYLRDAETGLFLANSLEKTTRLVQKGVFP